MDGRTPADAAEPLAPRRVDSSPLERFASAAVRDFALLGLLGAAAGWPLAGEANAAGFGAATLWNGLNVALLAELIGAYTPGRERGRLFQTLLACAKIPAAYLLLLWLFSREFLAWPGLVAGLATLPLVLAARGLLNSGGGAARAALGREE